MILVTRSTKKYISIIYSYKSWQNKVIEKKATIKDEKSLKNVLVDVDLKDRKQLISLCFEFLSKQEISCLKETFTPSCAQRKKRDKQAKDRLKWEKENSDYLDYLAKRESDHPGFFNFGYTQKDIDEVLEKESQKLYLLT